MQYNPTIDINFLREEAYIFKMPMKRKQRSQSTVFLSWWTILNPVTPLSKNLDLPAKHHTFINWKYSSPYLKLQVKDIMNSTVTGERTHCLLAGIWAILDKICLRKRAGRNISVYSRKWCFYIFTLDIQQHRTRLLFLQSIMWHKISIKK